MTDISNSNYDSEQPERKTCLQLLAAVFMLPYRSSLGEGRPRIKASGPIILGDPSTTPYMSHYEQTMARVEAYKSLMEGK